MEKQLDQIKVVIRELQSAQAALLKTITEGHPVEQRRTFLERYAGHKATSMSADLMHWVAQFNTKAGQPVRK